MIPHDEVELLRREYEDRMQRGLQMLWEREQTGPMDAEYDRWLAHFERLDAEYRALIGALMSEAKRQDAAL